MFFKGSSRVGDDKGNLDNSVSDKTLNHLLNLNNKTEDKNYSVNLRKVPQNPEGLSNMYLVILSN